MPGTRPARPPEFRERIVALARGAHDRLHRHPRMEQPASTARLARRPAAPRRREDRSAAARRRNHETAHGSGATQGLSHPTRDHGAVQRHRPPAASRSIRAERRDRLHPRGAPADDPCDASALAGSRRRVSRPDAPAVGGREETAPGLLRRNRNGAGTGARSGGGPPLRVQGDRTGVPHRGGADALGRSGRGRCDARRDGPGRDACAIPSGRAEADGEGCDRARGPAPAADGVEAASLRRSAEGYGAAHYGRRRRAGVGGVARGPRKGQAAGTKSDANPRRSAQAAPRCQARSKRSGEACLSPAVRGWVVCRKHGARGGAPTGPDNPA